MGYIVAGNELETDDDGFLLEPITVKKWSM